MNMKRFIRIIAVLALVALAAVPTFAAARGKADFTKFVAIGDSYGAGFESGSLNINHQQFSWPATIIRQAAGLKVCPPTAAATDVCFAEPLVSFPGIGNELQLLSVTGVIAPAPGAGAPLMTTFARPYDNLSVPGANVNDTITLKGLDPATSTAKAFAKFILRGQGTEADLALAQNPTFIAVWIGGNDVLGAVLAGTPALLTPTAAFTTAYNALLDKLVAGAPNAGIVVGNLPTNPLALPYLTTVPRVLVDQNRQVVLIGGQPVPLIADLGGGNIGPLPAGSFVVLPAANKIATGQGIPAALKAIPPFNQLPNVGVPLTDNDVLTPDEAAKIVAAATAFNDVITQAAAARNIPVADIKGLFDRIAAGQEFVGPLSITGAFVTGGAFSLDGFHMTDIGYTLFANEYIKTINTSYDTQIPLASVAPFFQNNDPSQAGGINYTLPLSPEAAATIQSFVPKLPAPSRHRATTH
jgi:lysophospholipase L1-like esterase